MTKHLQRDPRTGRLSFRRAFPDELRPFIPKQPRQLKRSLGAKSLHDREASRRFAEAQAEYERIVEAAQLRANGTSRQLASSDIGFLVQTYAHRLRKNLTETHFDPSDDQREWLAASAWRFAPFAFMDKVGAELAGRAIPWTNSERVREALPDLLSHWRKLISDGDRAGIISAEGQTGENLLAEFALTAELDATVFFDLCLALIRADIAAGVQFLRLTDSGEEIEPIEIPVAPASASPERDVVRWSASGTGHTLTSLAERLFANKVAPIGKATEQAWNTALRFWREVYGEIPCSDITRRKASEWSNLLSQRPRGLPKRMERLPLPALVERYAGNAQAARIAGKTVRQHLGSLSAIWNKAEKRGLIENMANPFAGHDVKVQHKTGGQPLTTGELNAVFRLPVFTSGERPKQGRGEAAYWIPLLALFTGARPGEIAQLIVSDFWQDSAGKWHMLYTDKGEHPAIGKRHLKTSRHGTGERQFPVPQTLIDLGLPAYLAWLGERKEVALFPELRATSKGLHDTWSRWWGPYVREHGAIPEGKRQTREFRHNFMTALRASGVSDEAISYLAGHSVRGGNTTRTYGDRSPYGAEIEKLRFEGLDLRGVKRWKVPPL
ncbi:hypothetical protein SZ64_09320 [Erythrobacter sp. SG61-1L]|uniref:DUF6538 domain-containing protein n=1 Tax=Erythrobacter sp. SG61-1L TaxID=1603897 RepID=UPI0006C8F17E|nr:DUF6538 domain-containing protein [Erythrobacter sp. SG61-1L]KPL68300.1 hypothetical protein SZ64_09320 [Erythrobacter sp. SG61-1L]